MATLVSDRALCTDSAAFGQEPSEAGNFAMKIDMYTSSILAWWVSSKRNSQEKAREKKMDNDDKIVPRYDVV